MKSSSIYSIDNERYRKINSSSLRANCDITDECAKDDLHFDDMSMSKNLLQKDLRSTRKLLRYIQNERDEFRNQFERASSDNLKIKQVILCKVEFIFS